LHPHLVGRLTNGRNKPASSIAFLYPLTGK
jgi:hypothetical protein